MRPLLGAALGLLAPLTATAHITLASPQPRYAEQKDGPCGRGSLDQRTTKVSTFQVGQTITVSWTETVDHPSHYRIAFDDDGQDLFQDPGRLPPDQGNLVGPIAYLL